MVKPTRKEILKYIKSPINFDDKMKIKEEKKIKLREAILFINKVKSLIKDLGNIEGLSEKEVNDKIDLLLATPTPSSSESDSESPTEEEDRENFRNAIRRQHEAAVRAKEEKYGLKKGALKVGSISFSDDEGKGIKKKKKNLKAKKKSAKRKRRKSLGKKSKKKNKKKSKKSGRRRGKRSVKRRGKRSGRSSRRR